MLKLEILSDLKSRMCEYSTLTPCDPVPLCIVWSPRYQSNIGDRDEELPVVPGCAVVVVNIRLVISQVGRAVVVVTFRVTERTKVEIMCGRILITQFNANTKKSILTWMSDSHARPPAWPGNGTGVSRIWRPSC